MQFRSLFSLFIALSLVACGGSPDDDSPKKEFPQEVCGDRVDGNGNGLDDYADPDCAFGKDRQGPLQQIVDRERGPVGALVLGMETFDGKVGLAASGNVKEGGREVRATDRFPIGSITKTFVAVAILQLRDEGKLSLEDPLSRWLPDFPRAEQIELRHLLSHTSGVFSYTDDPAFIQLMNIGATVKVSEMVEVAANNEPLFEPGERFEYSNSNFILLGVVLEAVTGNSAAAELRARIFEPLGMKDTFLFGSEEMPGGLEVHGYLAGRVGKDVDFTSMWNGTSAWTSGAVISTVVDMLRFSHGLFQGELLLDPTLMEMVAGVGDDGYGFGLSKAPTWIGHGGAVPGWLAHWVYLGNGATIVAFQNRYDDGSSYVNAINAAAALSVEWTRSE